MKIPPVNKTPANYPAIPQPSSNLTATLAMLDQLAQIAASLIKH